MAHNLNYNVQTGKVSFMSVKQKAWHGLGQIITDYPTSAEAIKFAGLDFEVVKSPNIHQLPSGVNLISENSYFTFRTDTEQVLGDKVGSDYQVVQNTEVFGFFDGIVGNTTDIRYETAGCLYDGQIIFVTAKLPEYIRVGRDDLIEQYLMLTSSHDGTGSITVAFTPVRVVCQNTLNAALKNHTNCIKIRHTASASDKLKQAYKMLGISSQLAEEMELIYNRWSRVKITDPELKRLVQMAMVPNREVLDKLRTGQDEQLSSHFSNMIDDVLQYACESPTQQETTTKGTLFGAYNAITGYFQNVRNYKDDESKFKSILSGTALARTQTAFGLCTDFVKIGATALN
ncbi:phage/plasmid-like protein (TIGR03299 family) [Pedobacter africanus]|uniref:DUF932 domain-containing protein n=1 Tax=Pedobacter africanus TaxID=151894 RepID=UPI00339928C4